MAGALHSDASKVSAATPHPAGSWVLLSAWGWNTLVLGYTATPCVCFLLTPPSSNCCSLVTPLVPLFLPSSCPAGDPVEAGISSRSPRCISCFTTFDCYRWYRAGWPGSCSGLALTSAWASSGTWWASFSPLPLPCCHLLEMRPLFNLISHPPHVGAGRIVLSQLAQEVTCDVFLVFFFFFFLSHFFHLLM